jgi:hypothetical protein
LDVVPDTATAFLFGDIPYRFQTFFPRHTLYRMEESSGPGMKEYRLQVGDYMSNESHNDTGYFDFVFFEAVNNSFPPTIGSGIRIDGFSSQNGKYEFNFTAQGGLENTSFSVLSVGDRINRPKRTACDLESPCPNGLFCLDGYCFDRKWAQNTINISACLTQVEPVNTSVPEYQVDPISTPVEPILMLIGVFIILAVAVSVSEGGRKLIDFWDTFRGLLR